MNAKKRRNRKKEREKYLGEGRGINFMINFTPKRSVMILILLVIYHVFFKILTFAVLIAARFPMIDYVKHKFFTELFLSIQLSMCFV